MSTTQQVSQVGTNAIPGAIGVSFLFVTALSTYGVRVWTRVRPTFQLSTIDYIITAALVSTQTCAGGCYANILTSFAK